MNTQLKAIESKFTPKQVIDIVDKHFGMVSFILKALDCTEEQWCQYLKAHHEVKYRMQQKEDELVDLATVAVVDNLNSKNEQIKQRAAETILKGLGKKRGWADSPTVVQNISSSDKEISVKNIFGI
jgi:hypothetical protein